MLALQVVAEHLCSMSVACHALSNVKQALSTAFKQAVQLLDMLLVSESLQKVLGHTNKLCPDG